jgi:2-isopropylmalate synthase
LTIFDLLSKAGIKRFVAGYPSAHRSESEALSLMVKKKIGSVFGLGRTLRRDVDAIYETGANIALHLPFHSYDLSEICDVIRYADRKGRDLEVALVDISSYEPTEATRIARAIFESGADVLQIADTTGKCAPKKFYEYVKKIRQTTGAKDISVHCHNDLGLAEINSYEGIRAGATIASTCVFGLGERNGIADLARLASAFSTDGYLTRITVDNLRAAYDYLSKILYKKTGIQLMDDRIPIFGSSLGQVTAGTHARESTFRFDSANLNVYCGKNLIRSVLSKFIHEIDEKALTLVVERIKDKSSTVGLCVKDEDALEIYKAATK